MSQAPKNYETVNRKVLIYGTGVLCALMMTLVLVMPNGSRDLKVNTFNTTGKPRLGNAGQGHELVVFSDYQCPACQEFELRHLPALKKNFVDTGRANIVMMHSPIFGADSELAAKAAICVNKQSGDAFWTYNKTLFEAQGTHGHSEAWINPDMLEKALPDGIDPTKWRSCLQDPTTAAILKDETQQHKRAGLEGTTTIFVDGRRAKEYGGRTIAKLLDEISQNPLKP